jgi:hypothetical protein
LFARFNERTDLLSFQILFIGWYFRIFAAAEENG